MRVHPALLAAIRRAPRHLQIPLLTTVMIESGGRLNAVGDRGDSVGPYQENIHGRGAGLSSAQRSDPRASTQRAIRDFQKFYRQGLRGGELAFAAQRPADKGGYLRRYDQYDDQAMALLGNAQAPSAGPQTTAQGLGPVAPTINVQALLSLLNRQGNRALRGQMPTAGFQGKLQGMASQYVQRANALVQQGQQPVVPPSAPTGNHGPGGGWQGSQGAVESLVKAANNPFSISSKKRGHNTVKNGRSDHWVQSRDSYAYDIDTPGNSPTPDGHALAQRLVSLLGGPSNWQGGNFTTTRNGFRYQVLWNTGIGGDHYNHIHVGARRVG